MALRVAPPLRTGAAAAQWLRPPLANRVEPNAPNFMTLAERDVDSRYAPERPKPLVCPDDLDVRR
jgi:hypothetical protein